MKALLSIAGYDPSGGAGVLLDVAVFRRFGYVGMGVVTSVTIQNSRRVASFRSLSGVTISRQYQVLAEEVSFAGIKVGMLGSRKSIPALQRILRAQKRIPIVVDPVFKSSSGRRLLERGALASFISRLRGNITLLTPNLEESSMILGRQVQDVEGMKEAARRIAGLFDAACLVKGGHLEDEVTDVLFDGRKQLLISHRKIPKRVHGTGCFLSSSLLCRLAEGLSLARACERAVEDTHRAIGKAFRVGWGGYVLPTQS